MRLHSFFGLALLLAACSDSSAPGGSTSSGGGSSGGSSGTSSGSSSGTSGGTGACPSASTPEIGQLSGEFKQLAISKDDLFTVHTNAGADVILGKSGVVLRVPKAGGAGAPFHTPDAMRTVQSIYADATDLFVAEGDAGAAGDRPGRIIKKNIATGTVTELLPTGIEKALVNFLTADDQYVYLEQASSKSGAFGIYRLAKAGGALETVVEVDSGAFLSTQRVGADFVFAAQTNKIHRVPLSNAGAPAASIAEKTCTGGFAVTSEALFCGQALEIEKSGPAFNDFQRFLRLEEVPALKASGATGSQPRLVTSDAVYVRFNPNGAKAPILRIDRATLAHRPVMCDAGWIDAMVADEQSLYALQVRNEKFETAAKLFKAPR